MKSIITIISFLFLTPTLHANQLNDFCLDAHKFVCESNQSGYGVRKNIISQVTQKLKFTALKKISDELSLQLNDVADIEEIKKSTLRHQAQKLYLVELQAGMRNYLKENNISPDYNFNFLQGMLKKSIYQSEEIPSKYKNDFTKIVDEIRFVSITSENTTFDLQVLKGCHSNGFEDNAFSKQKKANLRLIVICPGYVIGSIEYAKLVGLPQQYWMAPMMATIAHEIGHQFDSQTYPDAYLFLDQLLIKEKASLKVAQTPERYLSESSADYWGNRTMHHYLNEIKDPQLQAAILRGSLADLCDSHDDGVHPSGQFRMNVLAQHEYCQ